MHRLDRQVTKAQAVESCLKSLGFLEDIYEIFVPPKQDYAIVKFETVDDARHVFYTLQAYVLHEWMLDFEPMSDREHLKLLIDVRNKLQKKLHVLQMAAWSSSYDHGTFQKLAKVQQDLLQKTDALTVLVKQSLRQVDFKVKEQGLPKTQATLTELLGTDAVSFMEAKHGSVVNFIEKEMDKLASWIYKPQGELQDTWPAHKDVSAQMEEYRNHQQQVRMHQRRQQELEEMMLAPDTCQEMLMHSTQKQEQLQSKQTLGVADADFAMLMFRRSKLGDAKRLCLRAVQISWTSSATSLDQPCLSLLVEVDRELDRNTAVLTELVTRALARAVAGDEERPQSLASMAKLLGSDVIRFCEEKCDSLGTIYCSLTPCLVF